MINIVIESVRYVLMAIFVAYCSFCPRGTFVRGSFCRANFLIIIEIFWSPHNIWKACRQQFAFPFKCLSETFLIMAEKKSSAPKIVSPWKWMSGDQGFRNMAPIIFGNRWFWEVLMRGGRGVWGWVVLFAWWCCSLLLRPGVSHPPELGPTSTSQPPTNVSLLWGFEGRRVIFGWFSVLC